MNIDIGLLVLTALSIGCIHTLLGPDHYLPFVAMSAARRWTRRKTLLVTALCGVGPRLGSILSVPSASRSACPCIGWSGWKASAATWPPGHLSAFGLVYMTWGLKRAWRTATHTHDHVHADGTLPPPRRTATSPRTSTCTCTSGRHGRARSITPWALFVVFILGPCEPLIPFLMYPASQHSSWGVGIGRAGFRGHDDRHDAAAGLPRGARHRAPAPGCRRAVLARAGGRAP